MIVGSHVERDSVHAAWPRGYPRPCLLLLIAEQPSHGYDLVERLTELEAPAIDAGTLYRTLRAMEREAVVASRWEVSSIGPARRIYRITPLGREVLRAWVEVMADSHRALSSYLHRYESLAGRRTDAAGASR